MSHSHQQENSLKHEKKTTEPLGLEGPVASDTSGFITPMNPSSVVQRRQREMIDESQKVQQGTKLQQAIDQSPRIVAQRKRKSDLFGDTVQKKKQEDDETVQKKFSPVQKKGSSSALPSNIKTGAENLSGFSMDDVNVHYNSSEPEKYNAHAFAKGNEIHLGQGQERHLPHEAWHVVQQKQGRVQPSTQQNKSVQINDDPGLEKEADQMGEKIVQAKTENGKTPDGDNKALKGEAPVQRQKKPFPTSSGRPDLIGKYKKAVEETVEEIERRVDAARGVSLNWGQLLNDQRAHVVRWATTAQTYFNNPGTVPDFLHARFGYSIETIACDSLPAQHQGLNIDFQVSTGHTRPDIVLTSPTDGVIAWIDITSNGSVDHILGKDGAGWKSKPFVYEVLYNPLQLNEVLQGMQDPVYKAWGEYLGVKNQATYEEEEKATTDLRNGLVKLQMDNDWSTGVGNAQDKQGTTKEHLESIGMNLGNSSKKATKGALAVADISDGPYGFNVGNIGTDSAPAKRYIKDKAKPEIESRHNQIDTNYLEHYQDIIADHGELEFVKDFERILMADTTQPAMELGTAVAVGVQQSDELDQEYKSVGTEDKDVRIVALLKDMQVLAAIVPKKAEFAPLRDWCNKVVEIKKRSKLLKDTRRVQNDFNQYLKDKYGNNYFFSRNIQEATISNRLALVPQDDTYIQEATQYMSVNAVPQAMNM